MATNFFSNTTGHYHSLKQVPKSKVEFFILMVNDDSAPCLPLQLLCRIILLVSLKN